MLERELPKHAPSLFREEALIPCTGLGWGIATAQAPLPGSFIPYLCVKAPPNESNYPASLMHIHCAEGARFAAPAPGCAEQAKSCVYVRGLGGLSGGEYPNRGGH